jgi:hypothetical protein
MLSELEAGLPDVVSAPRNQGVLEMIVRRPGVDARETLVEGVLDGNVGLEGDSWAERFSRRTPDGKPGRDTQITIMSSRAAELIAGSRDRWPLAGDQLYVGLDVSVTNLPPGTNLTIVQSTLEVTTEAHNGCAKFAARFGADVLRFVNSVSGRELRLRGLYARVVKPGRIRVGDTARRISIR